MKNVEGENWGEISNFLSLWENNVRLAGITFFEDVMSSFVA